MMMVGQPGQARRRNLDALAVNGRLIAIAATGLRARPLDEKAAIIAAVHEHVWPLIDTGTVKPVIDRVLPPEAHRLMETSNHIGKILLQA